MKDRSKQCSKCGSMNTELQETHATINGNQFLKRFKVCKACGSRVRKKMGDYCSEKRKKARDPELPMPNSL